MENSATPGSQNENSEQRVVNLAIQKLTASLEGDTTIRREELEQKKKEHKHRTRRNYLITAFVVLSMSFGLIRSMNIKEHVAVIRIDGVIAESNIASARMLVPAIKTAFAARYSPGVVLLINSPGGSPVQSSIIHDSIVLMRSQYPEKRVIAVAEDTIASGAYWIATAAPEIAVNRSTIAGSIGVINAGFGIDLQQLKKYGVERRVVTAGDKKGRNDPYAPQTPEDVARLKTVVNLIHQHFISSVLETRQDKLKASQEILFSGDHWTGEEAVALGLADELSDISLVIREKFGLENIVDYTPHATVIESVKQSLGVELKDFVSEILNTDIASLITAQ